MRPIAHLFLVLTLLWNISCSVNILENFADKTSNEALYIDAQKLIDEGDYAGALVKIARMTGSFSSSRRVVSLSAKAHAGVCGVDFMSFVLAMRNLGTTRLLPFLVSHFRGGTTTTKMDECLVAENLVESIGAIGERTTDENLLLAVISFAKIGVTLSYYADVDQDGTATAAYDVCTAAAVGVRTAGATMPDADAAQFGTGITLALANITAISSEVDLGSDSLDEINGICTALGGFNFCSKTDPTAFSAAELLAIRSVAKEGSSVGLDLVACAGGDLSSGACRCF